MGERGLRNAVVGSKRESESDQGELGSLMGVVLRIWPREVVFGVVMWTFCIRWARFFSSVEVRMVGRGIFGKDIVESGDVSSEESFWC